MQTRRIPIAEVDNTYIENLVLKWDDISELTLKISSRVVVNGKVKESYIFNQFKTKRQQLILYIKDKPFMRFVLTDSSKKEKFHKLGKETHNYIEKTLTFKSFECTLKEANLVLTEDIVRQLYKKDSLDISDGILDIFEKEQGWTIGNFPTDLNYSTDTILQANTLNLTNKKITNKAINRGTLLFSENFSLVPNSSNDYIDLNYVYKNVSRIDSTNSKVYSDSYVKNTIEHLPYTVTNVKAYYDKSPIGRYSIKYVVTYINGYTEDKYVDFPFCDNMSLSIGEISANYTNGKTYQGKRIKYRTFVQGTYNWLELLRNNIANVYGDLYFKFDTINFKIDVYKKENYGEKSNIILSYDNFIKEINKKDIMDDIITALNVESDLVSIADVNPYQSRTIYNFDYFIRKGMMTKELQNAWSNFYGICINLNGQAVNIRSEMNTYNKLLIKQESQKSIMENNINLLQIRRTDYIANNKDGINNSKINTLSAQINTEIASFESIMTQIEKTKVQISNLSQRLEQISLQTNLKTSKDFNGNPIFSTSLIEELNDILIEETVSDNVYTVSRELYDKYYLDLALKNKNPIEFSTNISGLVGSKGIKMPKNKNIMDYITLGTFFEIEDDSEVVLDDRGLRLVEIKLKPKNSDISLTLTNRDKQNEKYSGISNVSNDVDKANAYINNYKQLWNESFGYNDYLNKIFSEGMDLRATSIRGKNNRVKFDFTESGLYIIDAYNEDIQIYLGAGMVCFTKDRWLTCSTALDGEGLVAKNIYGELILGKRLVITTENGDFIIGNVENSSSNAFGLQLYEKGQMKIFLGTELESDGLRHAKLVMYDPEGKEVVLSDQGILQTNQFVHADNIDSSHPIAIPYRAIDGCEKFKSVILTTDFYHYRAYEKTAISIDQQTSNSSSLTTTNSGGGCTSNASSISTTNSGGGCTSNASSITTSGENGDHKHVLFAKADIDFSDINVKENYYGVDANGKTSGNTEWGGYYTKLAFSFFGAPSETVPDYLYTGSSSGTHSHNMSHTHTIPSHSHGMSHTHGIPSHTHGMNHTHTINGHGHNLDYGIYEDPTNMDKVEVWVNHRSVGFLKSGQSIDIASHLNINSMNLIEFTSGCNGRIVTNIASKYWQKW